MGSCASIYRNSGSTGKFRASLVHSETDKNPNSMPPTPLKNNPTNVLVLDRPISSQLPSVTSFSSYGSKEEAFFDSQPWLESDCEDDFYSVNGDFTPSRGSTPLHGSRVGTPRRTLSPTVNRSIYEGKPRVFNEPNRSSRDSTPLHRSLSASATSPVVDFNGVDSSAPEVSPTEKKKMTLVDLFRESTRESQQDESNHEVEAETPKSSNTTSYIPGTNSESSSCKRTPTQTKPSEEENLLKSAQCCFPRLPSARGFKRTLVAAPPPISVDA